MLHTVVLLRLSFESISENHIHKQHFAFSLQP